MCNSFIKVLRYFYLVTLYVYSCISVSCGIKILQCCQDKDYDSTVISTQCENGVEMINVLLRFNGERLAEENML